MLCTNTGKLAQIQPRTWIAKKIVLDCAALEEFYANPDNKNKLFHSTDCMGEENVTLPQMLALPPDFVWFCVDVPPVTVVTVGLVTGAGMPSGRVLAGLFCGSVPSSASVTISRSPALAFGHRFTVAELAALCPAGWLVVHTTRLSTPPVASYVTVAVLVVCVPFSVAAKVPLPAEAGDCTCWVYTPPPALVSDPSSVPVPVVLTSATVPGLATDVVALP